MNSPQSPLPVDLSPAQERAGSALLRALDMGSLFELRSKPGHGRTTVLHTLRDQLGGHLVTISDFVHASERRHPLALEDALYETIVTALQEHEAVLVDDFHVATAVMGHCHFYPRAGMLDAPLTAIAALAQDTGKKLIIASDRGCPGPISDRSFAWRIEPLQCDDYEHLCRTFLEGDVRDLEFDRIHHFAPKLNAHQLKGACIWLRHHGERRTDDFIEYLRSQRLASNVELGEVTQVTLAELKGVDDVVQSLEANVVMPLENQDLAEELGLHSKRGVLLAGPPGTGKTTVGRALAHRLRGKFFLIDGTYISGTRDFYSMVHRTFRAAMDNAPSIIFIDDSDVVFESGQEHGLYRYLLTMLDGLESESAGRVCVMMTAMNVGNLPPALIRSGRVELWLEMRLPDEAGRREIIVQQLARIPEVLRHPDLEELTGATDGFTGADLNRMCEDAKVLYAFDRASGREIRGVMEYFRTSIEEVRRNKERYAAAEAQAHQLRPQRPPWFDVGHEFVVEEED